MVVDRSDDIPSPVGYSPIGMTALMEASEALFSHDRQETLVPEIIRTLQRFSGARRAVLILLQAGVPALIMERSDDQETCHTPPVGMETSGNLPVLTLQHVMDSRSPLALTPERLADHPVAGRDPYLAAVGVQSGLCLPLVHADRLSGVLYLEHPTAPGLFRDELMQSLLFLTLQATVSLEKAQLSSHLKQAVQARQQAEETAELARSDLAIFSCISAHHLQEPTRHLLIYSRRLDDLIRGQLDNPEALLSLNFIHAGALRLRNLVRDIERYLAATETRGLMIRQNTHGLVELAVNRLSPRFQQTGATIDIRPLPWVYLDQPRLMEIFQILLENALVHRQLDRPPHIRISGERVGMVTRISVEDNGPGIPAEYRSKVFGLFERLDRNPEAGTGIGLAIVRRIVENRHGCITIKNSDLGGAAIVFELPDEPHQS